MTPLTHQLSEALRNLREQFTANRHRISEQMGDNPRWQFVSEAITQVLAAEDKRLAQQHEPAEDNDYLIIRPLPKRP